MPTPPVITNAVVESPRPALWVDSFASTDGDGSVERPFKRIPSTLPARAHLHVKSGLYQGPFSFEGVIVEGHGEAVLTSEAGQTTVTANDVELRGLSIQGGALGLAVLGRVSGTKLFFSGQRERAARVDGELVLSDSRAVASVEGIDGFAGTGTFRFEGVKLEGGFRRGVWCERGVLALSGLKTLGVKVPVFAMHCTGEVKKLVAESGAGPAMLVSEGSLNVLGLYVRGHEYGLQMSSGAKVSATGLDVSQTEQACVSALQSELTLTQSEFTVCGGGGAILLLDSSGVLSGLKVHDTRSLGVLVRQGAVAITASEFSRITSEGDALGDAVHVRQSKAVLKAVRVTDVEGSALFATAFAEVKVESLEVERARQSALFVERGANVEVESLLVRGGGGGAVLVPGKAHVSIRSLSVAGGTDMPIYAECAEGAEVELGRIESTVQQLKSRCITRLEK